MEKEKLTKILLLISLIIIALYSHFTANAQEYETTYGGAGNLVEFTELNWDDVKDLELKNIVLNADYNGDGGTTVLDNTTTTIYGYRNSMCFHGHAFDPNNLDKDGDEIYEDKEKINLTLGAIIDIDENGNVTIQKYKWTWEDAEINSYDENGNLIAENKKVKKLTAGEVETINLEGEDRENIKKGAKALAAYSTQVTIPQKGERIVGDANGKTIWETYRHDFWWLIDHYNLRTIFKGTDNNIIPDFGDGDRNEIKKYDNSLATEEGKYALAYAENDTSYINPKNNQSIDYDKVYKARMFIFYSPWNNADTASGPQDRAILFGTEKDAEKVDVKKYITSIDYSNTSKLYPAKSENVDDRSEVSEKYKYENPIGIYNGKVKVNYTIKVTNNSKDEVTGTLSDIYDTELFKELRTTDSTITFDENVSITNNNGKAQKGFIIKNKGSSDGKITLKEGESIEVHVSLQGYLFDIRVNPVSGKYENKAIFETDRSSYYSSDWVEIQPIENVEIDKYITSIEDLTDNSVRGDIVLRDQRAGRTISDKENDPVITRHSNIKINYAITIKNTGTIPISGVLSDTYSERYFYNLYGLESYKNQNLVPGETRRVNISLYLNSNNISEGRSYENKAIFEMTKVDGTVETFSSSDWVKLEPKKIPKINKYIYTMNDEQQDRSSLNEETKVKNPVIAKYSETNKVVYKVEINNPNNSEIEGLFSDKPEQAINITNITVSGDGLADKNTVINKDEETNLKILANKTVVITIEATISQEADGLYRNTAIFKTDNSQTIVETSDYILIQKETETKDNFLKKYITKVEKSSGEFETERSNKDAEWKRVHPAEVEQGSIVTYMVELSFTCDKKNISEYSDELGGYCPDHYNKYIIDELSCDDIFTQLDVYVDEGQMFGSKGYKEALEFKSINKVEDDDVNYESLTYEYKEEEPGKVKIIWKNVTVDDMDKEQKVRAELTFEVKAGNLHCMNLENKVKNIQYKLHRYTCIVNHGNVNKLETAKDGETEYCDHTNCKFECSSEELTGTLKGEDTDYVRLLDPIVSGKVFIDRNGNNLYDPNSNEELGSIPRQQYKDIIVELCNMQGHCVAWTKVDPNTGEYSFGRVRRGDKTHRIVAEGEEVPEYVNIGEGNNFY